MIEISLSNPKSYKSIPSTLQLKNELRHIRQRIDQIDKQIIELIAERFMFVDQLNQIKLKENLSITQKQRENQMFKQRKKWSKEFGLSEDLIISIMKLLVKASKEKQKRKRVTIK